MLDILLKNNFHLCYDGTQWIIKKWIRTGHDRHGVPKDVYKNYGYFGTLEMACSRLLEILTTDDCIESGTNGIRRVLNYIKENKKYIKDIFDTVSPQRITEGVIDLAPRSEEEKGEI